MISVLCPSRGRPELLARSIASLRNLASSGSYEVIVASDDDDPSTTSVTQALDAVALVLPRAGYEGLHVYYAEMAAVARGDRLLVWNDDAQMLTPGWDTILEALTDGLLVADLQSPHSPLCCFPAVHRAAVETLGFFSTANPHVDTFWQDVGRATGTIAAVPIRVSCDTPVKPGLNHGYYSVAHQAELQACAEKISAEFQPVTWW